MLTQHFERPADIEAPKVTGDIKDIPAPPTVQPIRFRPFWTVVVPITLVVGIIGTITMLFVVGARTFTGVGLFFPVMMVMSAGGMFAHRFSGGGGATKKSATDSEGERRDYARDTLDELRSAAHSLGHKQFARVRFFNPHPSELVGLLGSKRMWCHQPTSAQFGQCRMGTGLSKLAMDFKPAKLPHRTKRDPMPNAMLRDFTLEQPYIRGIPRPLSLRSEPGFGFYGDLDKIHALIRCMLCELATFHGPDHMGFVVVTASPSRWEWMKWLPHACDPDRVDGAGSARMIFTSPAEFDSVYDLNNERAKGFARVSTDSGHEAASSSLRHLIVIDDNTEDDEEWEQYTRGGGVEAITFLRLSTTIGFGVGWQGDSVFHVSDDGRLLSAQLGHEGRRAAEALKYYATADAMSVDEAAVFARAMAKWSTTSTTADLASLSTQQGGLMQVLRIDDARYPDTARLWAARNSEDSKLRNRFPLGRYRNGALLEMNTNSTAAIPRGMGNHGFLLGATGSGKSWTLLAIGLSIILTHAPWVHQLIVLDWKGRSFGRRLAPAPHTLMVLSNLGKDEEHSDRMDEVLLGLVEGRQERLDAVSVDRRDIDEADAYERIRVAENHDWEPMPWVTIIVDEFSELFDKYPNLVDTFTRIGRVGRALHINLIMGSQTMEESKLKKMPAHFNWRLALRAFNDQESRNFIGDTRAAKISKDGGGRGFLKIGEEDPQEIQVFDVGSLYRPMREAIDVDQVLQLGNYFAPQLFTRKFVARESPASLVRGWSASILFPGWPLPGVAAWPPLVGARHYRDWYECRGW